MYSVLLRKRIFPCSELFCHGWLTRQKGNAHTWKQSITKQYNSGVLKKRETVHMREIKEGLDGAARRINLYFEPFFFSSS